MMHSLLLAGVGANAQVRDTVRPATTTGKTEGMKKKMPPNWAFRKQAAQTERGERPIGPKIKALRFGLYGPANGKNASRSCS